MRKRQNQLLFIIILKMESFFDKVFPSFMVKRNSYIIITFLMLILPCHCEDVFASSQLIVLDGFHKFSLDDKPVYSLPDYDDSQWLSIKIPGSWQSQNIKPAKEIGWYRIRFSAPDNLKNLMPAILLGRIGDVDEVFLNGVKIGSEGLIAERFIEATKVERLYRIPDDLLRYDATNHPLHVESVAWIAERKDVLSTLFWILTMGAYLQYVRRPGIARYVLVTVPFGLGLLCKPMLVTLPFALLLLDWWPLGRMRPPGLPESAPTRYSAPALLRLASEKVPLLALAAMSCVMTYLAQARGGLVPIEVVPFGPRVSNALVSYADYLAKTAWPVSLAVFYPHPALLHVGVPAWKSAGALLALAGISAVALRQR